MSIEEARGLLGEHIAVLHHYGGDDPGYKNVLDGNVRAAADAYALEVLEEAWDTAQDEYSGNPHPDGTDALDAIRAIIGAQGG